MPKSPPMLVAAVIEDIHRLAAMTPDQIRQEEDVDIFMLLDYCLTLVNEIEGEESK